MTTNDAVQGAFDSFNDYLAEFEKLS